ncbi:MAG: response regulator transcription factor, partial [Oscillospiraceae bacterium]
MRRILVVEDENSIREMIALNLNIANFEVVEADSAEAALEILQTDKKSFEVAILDVMLPGMNGFSLCECIRRDYSGIGVIILSAKSQEADKINGLSIGADDYMTKPFSVSELLARVDALCRRVTRGVAETETDSRLVSGPFILDQKSRILFKNGEAIDLTQVEYQIIELFFQNPAIAMDRDKILEGVWGENY